MRPEVVYAVDNTHRARVRPPRIPVPAAGHLGILEDACTFEHADEDRPGISLLRRVGGWVCPDCRAAA